MSEENNEFKPIPLEKLFDTVIESLDNQGVLSTVLSNKDDLTLENFSSEKYSDEEYHTLENMFELSIESIDNLNLLMDPILTTGTVNRLTMEALQRRFPSAINDNYPPVSFTKETSSHNVEVSLESFSIAKALAVAAVGALLGGILMAFIKLFRSDNLESRSEAINKKIIEVKKQEKEFRKELKAMDRNAIPPEVSKQFDDLVNNNLEAFKSVEMSKGNGYTNLFLENVDYGGEVFTILRKWQGSIQQRYTNFNTRINKLVGYLDVMYETKGADKINKLIKDFEDVMVDPDDPFFSEMKDLMEIMNKFLSQSGGNFSSFITENVFGTEEYYSFILSDDRWVKAADSITPKGSKELAKNLDGIEKSAQQLITGKRNSSMKAARGKPKVNGTVIEMGSVGINPNLERVSRDAEQAIRFEAQHFQIYRTNLNRILEFYRKSLLELDKMSTLRSKLLKEILNKPGS